MPHPTLGEDADPQVAAWGTALSLRSDHHVGLTKRTEHCTMNKSNTPMGFVSRDWSEVIGIGGPISNQEARPPYFVPTPVSEDNGKTLNWSRSQEHDSVTSPLALDTTIRCKHSVIAARLKTRAERALILPDDRKLSAIRLGVLPKTLDAAIRVAGDLRKRYDLLFLHLETHTPVRLTAVARWAVSVSKIAPHGWKAPIPTLVIEEYLSENANHNGSGSSPRTQTKDWKRVVDEFVSRCDELDQKRGRRRSGLPPVDDDDEPPKRSRGSSRASSISEGHVSPDDDGPSRKVVHDYD